MYTDSVEIIPITYDRNSGVETRGESFEADARAEVRPVSTGGSNGFSTTYTGLYILPPSTAIVNGYLIRPLTVNGEAVTSEFSKVTEIFRLGGGSPHHLEVKA